MSIGNTENSFFTTVYLYVENEMTYSMHYYIDYENDIASGRINNFENEFTEYAEMDYQNTVLSLKKSNEVSKYNIEIKELHKYFFDMPFTNNDIDYSYRINNLSIIREKNYMTVCAEFLGFEQNIISIPQFYKNIELNNITLEYEIHWESNEMIVTYGVWKYDCTYKIVGFNNNKKIEIIIHQDYLY